MGELDHTPMSDYLSKSDMPPLTRSPRAAFDLVDPDMADLPALRAPLAQQPLGLAVAADAADAAAARRTFERYRERQAPHTLRRQDGDLALFVQFLVTSGASDVVRNLTADPAAWRGISWGLVEGFVAWQLREGYAMGSVNVRLSTVKTYAKLAAKAGALSAEAYALIKAVAGYRRAEGLRVDAKRDTTRKGAKKAEPVSISRSQARKLKTQDAPREQLLMCLLLDHGLRVGEVEILEAKHFDLERGMLRFFRPKVAIEQTHRLTADTQAAAEDALPHLGPDGRLFPTTRHLGRLVAAAGRLAGLEGLSPHDCRHYWATAATRAGTPLKALQDAGGWSSPAMPLRYAESDEVANDRVRLD